MRGRPLQRRQRRGNVVSHCTGCEISDVRILVPEQANRERRVEYPTANERL
jgi:hypothetical protein